MRTRAEGNLRFEQCYGLEQNRAAQPAQKRLCWQTWARHFRRLNDLQRNAYVESRIHDLTAQDQGPDTVPPDAIVQSGFSPNDTQPPTYQSSAFVPRADPPSEPRCSSYCVETKQMCGLACSGSEKCKEECLIRFDACVTKCH